MGIREEMPLLARHEGVWDGVYTYYNAAGEKVDEHTSRLFCRFPDEGPHPYHQTNHYTWPDGRTEIRDFPAAYRDKRVWWDNELIVGSAWEDPDLRRRYEALPHLALDQERPARNAHRDPGDAGDQGLAGAGARDGDGCWLSHAPFSTRSGRRTPSSSSAAVRP
jgi:hypothetical protein